MSTLLAVALATVLPGTLPDDAFQRCAVRALRGDFGRLAGWQEAAYKRGLAQGVVADQRFFVTAYYATEGRAGCIDRYGHRCTQRTAAANELPRRSYVWVAVPGEVRQVLDCGAHFNDRVARRRGADCWIDLWYPDVPTARRAGHKGTHVTKGAVIR